MRPTVMATWAVISILACSPDHQPVEPVAPSHPNASPVFVLEMVPQGRGTELSSSVSSCPGGGGCIEVLQCAGCPDPASEELTVTFEGGGNLQTIGDIPDAGISMPGWITGIDIDEGGNADVAFEPSPSTVAGWMDEPWNRDIFFNPPARSVRFQVTTATFLTVEAYDATDSLLETKHMFSNWNTGPGGDPTGDYNAWDQIAFTSTHNQIARLNLSGGFNIGSIDDLIIVRGVSAGVDCAPVTRGDTATCKIDAEVDTVLAWEFAADSVVLSTGMSGSWVNPGPTAQLEWEGPAVHSGTVRAEVLQDSAPATLYGRLDVADRPWRWGEEDWSYDSLKPAHTCSDPWRR